MPKFETNDQARIVFTTLFEILLEDETFSTKVTESDLSLHLIHTKPDVELFVAPDVGVTTGPPPRKAAITIKMSCDTAHSLWMGDLLVPLAVATRRVRIKGSVSKVMEFVPILQPAFDRYPEIASTHGIAA